MPLQRIRQFTKSDVFKSFTVLFSGTLMAQVIGYAIAPILTRLYSNAEMGEMLYYMRLIAFISSIATLRYEAALPLPKRDEHSYLMYRFVYLFSFWLLVFIACFLLVFSLVFDLLNFQPWFILCVILGTAAMIVINVGTSWAVRTGTYGIISRQKITNSLVSNAFKWGFFFFNWNSFGLILATLLGFVISALEFIWDFRKTHHRFRTLFSSRKTRVVLKEHREFPLLNLPHVFIDNGRDMLLATLILAYFGEAVYGSYGHAYQMLRIPLMLVGVSVGQLFYNRSSEAMHKIKELTPILTKTIGVLTLISIVPFTILFFYGTEIFGFVFGTTWGIAGTYAETMAFWLMVNFVLSPISALPLLLNKQRYALIMGVVSSLIQVIPFWVFPLLYGKSSDVFLLTLQTVSYVQAIWLIFTLYLYYRFALASDANIRE
ncbi:MAG: lipopolysaccharide biosynthesis protein [Flavobacteriales bacterium]